MPPTPEFVVLWLPSQTVQLVQHGFCWCLGARNTTGCFVEAGMTFWVDLFEWLFSCGPAVNSMDNNDTTTKFHLGKEDRHVTVCRSDSKRPKHQQDSSPCQAKNAQTECFTSPLEPIKNKASVPKQPNASSSRASAKQKTVRNAHITTSRNVDSERWLLKVSSASDSKRPKHQQDSSPCQAKNTQTECFTSPLEPIKNKASVPKHPNASSSRASAKQKTVRKAHITTSRNVDSERWLLKVSSASDSKRPKHQQDSSPCQAKNTQTECFTSPLEPIKNKAERQKLETQI